MKVERRKYVTQMTKKEKDLIEHKLEVARAIVYHNRTEIGKHALERMQERSRLNVSEDMIIESIMDSRYYEYKLITIGKRIIDERVLLKSNKVYGKGKKKANLTLVYSLKKNEVITFWENSLNDNHSTIDINSIYDKKFDICGVLNNGYN